jgi:hypothetical protein
MLGFISNQALPDTAFPCLARSRTASSPEVCEVMKDVYGPASVLVSSKALRRRCDILFETIIFDLVHRPRLLNLPHFGNWFSFLLFVNRIK